MTCCFAWCCLGKRRKKGDKHGRFNDRTDTRTSDAIPVPPNGNGSIQARSFQFRELASATRNFTSDYLLGEGGFGRVYKGCLDNTNKTVAVKQLDRTSRTSLQGNREFLVEVLMLSLLRHPNLVKLVGYCADGDQRHLVYEYMNNGSLQDHLFDLLPNQTPLDWYTRMKIAYGAAQGLEYLHDKANPPVIYGDLKSCNILLDDALTPKLSDFGLTKLGPMGDMPVASSRVKGTYGYCAPEYARGGQISLKSDVYSFGVVLLELITGRRAVDISKPNDEQTLVSWAQPMLKDQQRYTELVDPLLESNYPIKGLNQAIAIAAMCLQEEPSVRPLMSDVVVTLSFLIQEETSTLMPQQSMSAPPDQMEILSHHSRSSLSSSYTESIGDHVIETVDLGMMSRDLDGENSLRSSSRSSKGSGGEEEHVRAGSNVSLSEKSESSSRSSSFKSLMHSPSPSIPEGDYVFDENK